MQAAVFDLAGPVRASRLGPTGSMSAQRTARGVLEHHIQQPVNDPRYVVIDLDFATTAEAETFLDFLRATVWSSPVSSTALDGTPAAMILRPAGAK